MSKQKSKRGFAAMDSAKQREIASRGGKAAQKRGAHRWTPSEAVEAGRKGGKVAQARGTGFRFDSETGRAAAARRRKRR